MASRIGASGTIAVLLTALTLIQAFAPGQPDPAASRRPSAAIDPQSTRRVELNAAFSPERLGHGTTVRLGVRLSEGTQASPSVPIEIRLWMPIGLSVATSDLGLKTCSLGALQKDGLPGCPTNSLMGRGSAIAEVPFGARYISERVRTTLFAGPLRNGHPELLFLASGDYPVLADIAFAALVLPGRERFGGMLDTLLPVVPSVPHGPDVALVRLQTTIGPAGITYYETARGRTIAFRPRGILLPASCPRGGFPFALAVVFENGERASAHTAVPCPKRHRPAPRGR